VTTELGRRYPRPTSPRKLRRTICVAIEEAARNATRRSRLTQRSWIVAWA